MPIKIGYARVSTRKQDLSLQLDALRAAGCDPIFTDKMSGSRDDRPELARCLAALSPGSVLVVWRLDRLGRSLPHLLQTISDLGEQGVGFQSLHGHVDTTDATGRLILTILAALAEFERELTKERNAAVLAAAKSRGAQLGRRTVLSEERRSGLRQLLSGGMSPAQVARTAGIGRATLYRHRDELGF